MFLYGLEDSSVSLILFARFILADNVTRFTQLVYLPEGQLIMDALWEETIAEFEFAGVRDLLKIPK